MATNLEAKMGQITTPPALIGLSMQNGMGYLFGFLQGHCHGNRFRAKFAK